MTRLEPRPGCPSIRIALLRHLKLRFGDDISDFPLTQWTFRLWCELDVLRSFSSDVILAEEKPRPSTRQHARCTLPGMTAIGLRKDSSRLWPVQEATPRILDKGAFDSFKESASTSSAVPAAAKAPVVAANGRIPREPQGTDPPGDSLALWV